MENLKVKATTKVSKKELSSFDSFFEDEATKKVIKDKKSKFNILELDEKIYTYSNAQKENYLKVIENCKSEEDKKEKRKSFTKEQRDFFRHRLDRELKKFKDSDKGTKAKNEFMDFLILQYSQIKNKTNKIYVENLVSRKSNSRGKMLNSFCEIFNKEYKLK